MIQFLSSIFLFLLVILPGTHSHQQKEMEVKVEKPAKSDILLRVTGIRNNKGSIRAIIFNNKEGWPDDPKKGIQSATHPAREGLIDITFENLPHGNYAITLMHDENDNEKMDTNFLGVPKEGYGFSTNFKPKMSAPKYDQVKFPHNGSPTKVGVSLIY